jgi:hypothetical protein
MYPIVRKMVLGGALALLSSCVVDIYDHQLRNDGLMYKALREGMPITAGPCVTEFSLKNGDRLGREGSLEVFGHSVSMTGGCLDYKVRAVALQGQAYRTLVLSSDRSISEIYSNTAR